MNMYKAKQNGMALIMSLLVLLALTLVSVSALDSSSLQSVMVRNSQFRLETFNAANAEIDAQLDSFSSQLSPAAGGLGEMPDEILYLDLAEIGESLWYLTNNSYVDLLKEDAQYDVRNNGQGANLYVEDKIKNLGFDKALVITKTSEDCLIYGDEVGSGSCIEFELESKAQYTNTNARSDQVQTFRIENLATNANQ